MNYNNSKKFLTSLNGLKVLAMLAIFWWHAPLIDPPIDMGARACEFLFVVSGFLSAYNYKYTHFNVGKEAVRRSMAFQSKYFELNLATMLLVLGAKKMLSIEYIGNNFACIISNIFNLQGWFSFPTFNGATWFLCPLLASYFCVPIFMRVLSKAKTVPGLLIIVFMIRFILEKFNGRFWDISVHTFPMIRILEFLMGMCLYPIYNQLKNKYILRSSKIYSTLLEMASILLVLYLFCEFEGIWSRAAFCVCSLVIVMVFSFEAGIISELLGNRFFNGFGKIQLQFFVLHQAIMIVGTELFATLNIQLDNVIYSAFLFTITILMAIIYKYFFYDNAVRRYYQTIEYIKKILLVPFKANNEN